MKLSGEQKKKETTTKKKNKTLQLQDNAQNHLIKEYKNKNNTNGKRPYQGPCHTFSCTCKQSKKVNNGRYIIIIISASLYARYYSLLCILIHSRNQKQKQNIIITTLGSKETRITVIPWNRDEDYYNMKKILNKLCRNVVNGKAEDAK